jgi:molybdenum cofactor synthesis domain-containing protein
MFKVGIVILSDKGSKGEREDLSGPKIREMLPSDLYEVKSYKVISDDQPLIEAELIRLCDEVKCDLVLTSGGTGLSPRDVTPEATLAVAERNVPGIAEAIRANSMQYTKRAMLSRAVSVTREQTLIINMPGSPKAVSECLEYILSELPHAIGILSGADGECGRK